jgi:hypothetical protein
MFLGSYIPQGTWIMVRVSVDSFLYTGKHGNDKNGFLRLENIQYHNIPYGSMT